MLVEVPDVLTRDQVARFRKELDATDWIDGKVTAGFQSAQVKNNMQLPGASTVEGAGTTDY